MNYLITEKQLHIITENNKKLEAYQNLINKELKSWKLSCAKHVSDFLQSGFNKNVCDSVKSIDKIVVDRVGVTQEAGFRVKLDVIIYYSSKDDLNFDFLMFSIQKRISNSLGVGIMINHKEINIRK